MRPLSFSILEVDRTDEEEDIGCTHTYSGSSSLQYEDTLLHMYYYKLFIIRKTRRPGMCVYDLILLCARTTLP